jgi:DNA-binding response OmpR family regulator
MPKLKILIVDDEMDYCLIMKSYFQSKGYEVFLAFTLKEGLKKLEEMEPEILVLDNNLPDGQGWDCIDSIIEQFPSLKIYLISAYRQKSDVLHTIPNVTIWEKPISLSLLDTTFQRVN